MKLTFIILSLLLVLMGTRAIASVGTMPVSQKPEKAFVCWKAMQPHFKRDGVVQSWRAKMRPDNSFMYTAPTGKLSRWWTLDKEDGYELLVKESPYDRLIVRYATNNNCAPEVATVPLKAPVDGFTDAELARTLKASQGGGVIYSWSPFMDHSVRGIKTIREVAQKNNLALTIVLDPNVKEADALKALKKEGITGVKLTKMHSFEMRKRNTLMHFPNIVMYKNGRMVGPMVPGVMGQTTYSRVVGKYLE
jgi:hypothetical protein